MNAATLMHNEVSPEMAELLRAGAADHLGIICRPGQVQKHFHILRDAERLGYLRWLDITRPWITDAGRRAIGAPSQAEADRAKLILLCAGARKPLTPAKRFDPRTDFDYRSYKSMGWICTLVVRQPDPRLGPRTVRVGRSLTSTPQFLGARNSVIQPESDDRFVLTLVPSWMTRPIKRGADVDPPIFSPYPFPLDETDPAFTDDERAAWDRLRQVCMSVNSRIRNAGRREPQKYRFGENA